MKKFMMLMYGFEKPTPEIMKAWGQWFELIADKQVDRGHMANGREITKAGTQALSMDLEAITGYVIIHAESMEEAMALAEKNPYISGIRVYEIMGG